MERSEAEQLWSALGACRGLEDYAALLNFSARLTNPLAAEPLGKGRPEAIFPASDSTERRLVDGMMGRGELPDDLDLVEELRVRLDKGVMSLKPEANSGWYQYCQWCLESLVHDRDNLERKRLRRGRGYQKCLNELFQSLFGLTRETHIKQLAKVTLGLPFGKDRPKVTVKPSVRVEPLVTYYLRRAESYEFVQAVLEESFGAEGVEQLRRLTPDGAVEVNLAHELAWMVRLFKGLAQIAADDLGLQIQAGSTETALDWLKHRQSDSDLSQDIRCMVPLFYDPFKAKYKVLAVVGYTCRPVEISFAKKPSAVVKDLQGNVVDAELEFGCQLEDLVYPVAIQFYTDTLLNREQFRSLCNAHSSLGALREVLPIG